MGMEITYLLSAILVVDIVGVWIGMEMRLMAPEVAQEFDHHVSNWSTFFLWVSLYPSVLSPDVGLSCAPETQRWLETKQIFVLPVILCLLLHLFYNSSIHFSFSQGTWMIVVSLWKRGWFSNFFLPWNCEGSLQFLPSESYGKSEYVVTDLPQEMKDASSYIFLTSDAK